MALLYLAKRIERGPVPAADRIYDERCERTRLLAIRRRVTLIGLLALAVAAGTAATAARTPARLRGCGLAGALSGTGRLRTRMLRCALSRLLRVLLTLRGALARTERGRLAARRHRSLRAACEPLALVLRTRLGAPLSLSTLRARTAAATTTAATAV